MSVDVESSCFDFNSEGDNFKKLDKNQVINLMNDYYSGEATASELIKKYDLKLRPNELYTKFPPIIMQEKCPYDETNLDTSMPSKGGFSWFLEVGHTDSFCPICGHKNEDNCMCDNCVEARHLKEIRLKGKIKEYYSVDEESFTNENDLTLRDQLYTATLLRGLLSEDGKVTIPMEEVESKLAPTEKFTFDIVDYLLKKGLIKPTADNDISVFTSEDFPKVVYLTRAKYQILIKPIDGNFNQMISRLMYPDRKKFLENKQETAYFWKEIAESEAEEFLMYRMKAVGFEFSVGSKTRVVLNKLLETFSVGQVNTFIFRSVANALQWYTESSGISKKHAANSVITKIESGGERAIAEGWNVKSYSRNYNLDQSEISKLLYNFILEISELGFSEKPTSNF